MRDTTLFHFSKLFFVQNYRFLYHGDQKISWSRICRWRVVNSEIHLCSSDMKSDCIWRSISIQYVQKEPGVNSDLGNGSFWVVIRDAKHVDRSNNQSGLLKHYNTGLIASTDLDLKRCLLFRKCLRWSSLKAVSVPTSVIGGLRGYTATSDLVRCMHVCVSSWSL